MISSFKERWTWNIRQICWFDCSNFGRYFYIRKRF